MTNQIFVGVDVAKDWLDIYHASHGATRINNWPAAARSFAVRCAKEGVWVVFEAQPAATTTSCAMRSKPRKSASVASTRDKHATSPRRWASSVRPTASTHGCSPNWATV